MPDPTPSVDGGRRGRSRWLLGALAVLIPVVPIVIALLITGSSGSPARSSSSGTGRASGAPAAALTPGRRNRDGLALPAGKGSLVAYITRRETLRGAPDGRRIGTLETRTSFGTQTTALVRRIRGRWLGVVSPVAGNHRLGWIDGARVPLSRVRWALHADLTTHQLLVDHDGREVRHYLVATGRPTAPTPTGVFAVTDRLTTGQPEGPYGCCILALTALAPHAISDWDGGNRIAIHAYPITSTLGESVSHGCIHVTDAEGEWLLAHIPLGTPVTISSA